MRLSRWPIRARVTAAFAVAMSAVLALSALFVYLRVQSDLNYAIDSGLRSRADDVAALVAQADSGLAEGASGRLVDANESFAQVLDRRGNVFDSTPGVSQPALSAAELRDLSGPTLFDRRSVGTVEDQARLLAEPVSAQGTDLVVVVGGTVSDRDEALSGLLKSFAIGGPVAVVLVSGLGYLLAALGMAPVEAMRRRAEQVTLAHSGEQLPLPEADDEIHRLGETLNAMLFRLQQSFERERAFVADASHELRAPLAVLKAELEVTIRGGGYGPEVGAALRSAAAEVDQLSRLAEDLLLIARSQEGGLPVKLERVGVRALLESVIERSSDAASAKGRAVECVVPAGMTAALDPLRMRQGIGNLIDNALRYGAGRVVVRAVSDGDRLALSVSDEGPGFPASFADRAFERFSRVDASRARGGSGLGLAIVQAIARAHGGEARIEPNAAGATVRLDLPAAGPPPAPSQGDAPRSI